jgi:hypothetical protein
MKRFAIALLAFAPAVAAADEYAVEREAEASGITKRELRMLAGAPATYAEYRTSYNRARDKVRREAYYGEQPRRVRVVREPEPVYYPSEAPPRDEAETYALPPDE